MKGPRSIRQNSTYTNNNTSNSHCISITNPSVFRFFVPSVLLVIPLFLKPDRWLLCCSDSRNIGRDAAKLIVGKDKSTLCEEIDS